MLVSGTLTIYGTIYGAGANDAAKRLHERNKGVIFKNYAPFIDFISGVNNTQKYHSKYLDALKPMYNLIEYSDNYSKKIRKFMLLL